jgi:hypothetical protein
MQTLLTSQFHPCLLFIYHLPPPRYLFEGVELTAREKADLAYKQRVYELALERKQALEAVVDDGYRMPTNYGETLLLVLLLHAVCCMLCATALGCW